MCKRIFVIVLMLTALAMTRAEAQQLNYQAIARNANGVALTFRDVGIRLSIRDGSTTGSIVYSETRNIRTNQFGLFTVVIGSPGASNVLGSMASINWISGNKYLQVEIDPEGGTNYFQAGTSQLQAVPYALFANAAYPVGPAGGDLLGSTYPNPIIAPLAVTTGKIANQAITTPKIADLNVTTAKLADQAVTNPKIADNTIANIKLVNSRVTLNGLILNLGDAQDFALGTNGTDVNIVSAGSTHTFNFPDASIANRGLITPNAQTIGGNKTFINDITAARIIRAGGLAAQFLKADGSVDNNIYLTENQPIIVTATGDATGVSTSSRTAPVLPLTLATVNSAVGTYGNNITIPSITVNNKGLVTNVIANPIPTATATTSGLLTVGDWNIFNNKQNAIPLGSTAQYFRGDLSLSNFTTDVRNQLSAGTNITYTNGNIGLTNNSVTLNTLPLTLGGSQTFATGTTGIDFNISSVGSVHSFNIPTASVFARGLLSSTDYTNFNAAYSNRISSLTTTGTSGAATLSANVLNIPNYTYTLPAATATTLGGIIPGANITNTSGTISITGNNVIDALGSQTANRFLVAPNGSNGLPSFRALTTGDIPDNTVTNIKLANSSIFLGTTNIPLGTTANTLSGLTSITSGAFVGPLTGNASTASAWANARTISTTGDVTYTSNPFDGSGNTTGVATLANSGVTAGTYGAANSIPTITVDAKGRLTSVSTNLISGVSTLGSSLNSGNIIVGNAANIAAQVPVTGDVTLSNTGVTTIGALKVTDAMLAGSITDGKLVTISTAGKVANSATTATELNNINTIVSRDGSGNFSAGTITANLTGNVTGNVTGTAGSVVNNITFNNGGTGDASGITFNGSTARTISYNSIGASPLAGSTSFTTAGTITTGTWNGSVIGNAFGGAGTSNGLLKANGLGTVSAATAGTDYLAPFASQTQNFVYAAPSGANGTPSFRALATTDIPTLNQNTTGSAGSVLNSFSFNNSGTGDASGTSFNGSVARTLSYNSIGASPLIGSTSLTTLGTISTGTWNGSVIGNAFGGAGNSNGILKANGLGTVSAATAGTDYLAPFTSQTQNFFFAAPNGTNGTPSFRAIATTDIPTLNQNTTGSAGSVLNTVTFNNGGAGDASGTSFNGAAARTISYNSIGASPLAGSTSLTTTGTITAGTWNGSVIGNAFGGAGTSNGLLKADGAGLVSAATAGTDYLAPFTSQTQNFVFAAPTGANGTPSFRALATTDIPTLNQNTTGSAGSVLNTVTFNNGGAGDASGTSFNGAAARTISYNSIGASPLAGSTSLTTTGTITAGTWNGNIIGSAFGGTGNGFTRFTGPTTSEKTFTLPDANATILTDNAAVTIAQGGTGQITKAAAFDALSPMTTAGDIIYGGALGTGTRLPIGSNGQILTIASGSPAWASNTQWSATGNTGLTAGTNFLGTIDGVALQFKVQNTFAGQIHPIGLVLNTSFGLGSNATTNTAGVRNSAFGAGSLAVNDAGLDNTAIGQGTLSTNANGNNNTAVGQGALNASTGHSNTAVGQAALNVNAGANNNTAVGKSALVGNTIGTNNTGIGHNSLFANISGNANAALGQNSLSSNTGGHNNTAVGFEALKNVTSDGNVGIGHLAGVDATFSNSIAIGINSNISSNNAIAIGSSAIVSPTSNSSISIGQSATSSSLNAISIGTGANSSNSGAISIGQGATSSGENAVAIGTLANNTDAASVLLGGATNTLVKATGALTATGRITGTGARFNYRSATGAVTLTANDHYIKILAGTTGFELPNAANYTGQKFVIFNGTGSAYNTFTFETMGQSIIGNGWLGININGSVTLFSDGSNWLIESQN